MKNLNSKTCSLFNKYVLLKRIQNSKKNLTVRNVFNKLTKNNQLTQKNIQLTKKTLSLQQQKSA